MSDATNIDAGDLPEFLDRKKRRERKKREQEEPDNPEGAERAKIAHLWKRDPFDWYVEPFESSRMLFKVEKFGRTVYDPACGLGRIVVEARAAGYQSWGTDIVARSNECFVERNFLDLTEPPQAPDSIVSNPPFMHCNRKSDFAFVRRALEEARHKVALLLPANWHCGLGTARFLRTTPLYRYHCIAPRPSMPPGAVIAAGIKPANGTQDFAWYIFLKGYDGPGPFNWLTPDLLSADHE